MRLPSLVELQRCAPKRRGGGGVGGLTGDPLQGTGDRDRDVTGDPG